MNAQKVKKIRKFMKENMDLDPEINTAVYEKLKKVVEQDNAVLPNTNYKVKDRIEYTFDDGIKKICIVSKIDGYNTQTGELFMTLKEESTGIGITSMYDKKRKKL